MTDAELQALLEQIANQSQALNDLTTAMRRSSTGSEDVIEALEELNKTIKRKGVSGEGSSSGRSSYNAGLDNFAKSLEGSISKALYKASRVQGTSRLAGQRAAQSPAVQQAAQEAGDKSARQATRAGKSPAEVAAARSAASRLVQDNAASKASRAHSDTLGRATADLSSSFLSLGKSFTSGTSGAESFATAAQSGGKFLLATFGKTGPWAIAAQAALAAMVVAAKQADKQHAVFEQLQEAGANSAGGLNDVNKMLGNFGLSVEEANKMLSLLSGNTNALLMFRGTMAEASKDVAKTFDAMGESGLRKELKLLGISYEEQRQGLLKNTDLQGKLGQAQSMSVQQLAKSTADYLTEQNALTRLTGATRKDQEAARDKFMAREQSRFIFEKLKRSGRGDEAAALEKTNRQVSATLGEDVAAAFSTMSQGLLTEQNKGLDIATNGKASQIAMRKDLTPEQMVDELVKALREAQGGGIEQQAEFGNFEKLTGINYDKLMTNMEKTTDLEARRAKVEKELADLAKGKGSVKDMVELDEATLKMKKAFQDFVQLAVGPTTKVMSVLAKVGGALAKVLGFITEVIGPPLELLGTILGGIIDIFTGIADAIGSVFSTLGSIISAPFKFVGSLLGFAEGGYTGHGEKSEPAGIVHKGEYVLDANTTKALGLNRMSGLSQEGYADGGYTGDGEKYQPAGIVHKGEYVLDANTTKALGLNKMPGLSQEGYATGGKVGAPPQAGIGMDFKDINKNLLSFNDGLDKILKNKVLFGTGPESLVGPDGVLSILADTVKTITDGISTASRGLFDKVSKFFSDIFGGESGTSGGGTSGGGTRANATRDSGTAGGKDAASAALKEHDHSHEHEAPTVTPEAAKQLGQGIGSPLADLKVTSGFGMRVDPITGKQAGHGGVDLAGRAGDAIKAPEAGTARVVGEKDSGGYGNMVEILDAQGKVMHRMAHMSETMIKTGDKVEAGMDIGKVGSTGRSTGNHLHWEKFDPASGQQVDPMAWLAQTQGKTPGFGTTEGGAATGNPQAAQRGQNIGAPQVPNGVGPGFGAIAEKYETGGRGSGTVGYDTTGGTSYGKYQIASKVGSMDAYIKHLGETNPEAAAQLKAAGPSDTGSTSGKFVDTWKQLSQSGALGDTEASFMKKQAYDPAMAGIKNKGLQDMIGGDKGLQEMLFSTATQHGAGGASGIMNKVYKEGMSKEDLVNSVYAERGTKFGSSTPEVQKSVQNRFGREKNDILGLMGLPPSAPGAATAVAGAPGGPKAVAGMPAGYAAAPGMPGTVPGAAPGMPGPPGQVAKNQPAPQSPLANIASTILGPQAGSIVTSLSSLFGGGATAAPGMPPAPTAVAGPTTPMASATPGQTDLTGMATGAQTANQGVMQGGIGSQIDSLITTLTSNNAGPNAGATGGDTGQTQLLETIVSLQREQNSTLMKILQSSTA